MRLKDDKRQKNQLQQSLAFPETGGSEAPESSRRGTETSVAKHKTESPTSSDQLMEEICERENCKQAWARVKANKGSPGIDGMTVDQLPDYLKQHWPEIREQLLSGTYKPQPVKRVEIPKPEGGIRKLGIPTALDRWIQQMVLEVLQRSWDPTFSEHSFGFRPGRSAHQAVAQAQKYIVEGYSWTVDLDLEKFLDSIPHELLLRAVRKHTKCAWVLLYIERWLKAPVQLEDGTLEPREKGSPQGSVISPLLANLFLHWAFDQWMVRNHPETPFERFADDILCHCKTEQQARTLKEELEKRFAECGLQLHPAKRCIIYCKDDDRRGTYAHEKFDFLGYTFRARRSKNRWGKYFVNFSPGVSNRAAKAIRQGIRGWQLRCRADKWIDDLARMFNPIIRGWINYYGRYYKSALYPTLRHLDRRLAHWAMAKYKRLRRHRRRAEHWLREVASRDPALFAHWPLLHRATTGTVRAG